MMKNLQNTQSRFFFTILATLLVFCIVGCISQKDEGTAKHSTPHLKQTNGVTQLYVYDKPFIMLGGELHNSEASNLNYVAPVWKRMADLNVNTIILPVSWRQFEPAEKEFDYTLLDGLIKQAREHDLHVVFLWFGAWKNGMSGYCPEWVTGNVDRFPRMEYKDGKKVEVLSNLSDNLLQSELDAFHHFMKRIARIDSVRNTVLMVQIENEVGLRGDTRDYSPLGNEHFSGNVPHTLMDYLQENFNTLKPSVSEVWARNGKKMSGTWNEVFGNGVLADEIFMAWSYATYINALADTGKKAYNIPMFVNAWLHTKGRVPGIYPSGGPVARMLDIWMAGAPEIDLIAPDIYEPEFKLKCRQFVHNGNPLFIPEACAVKYYDTVCASAKAYYAIANHNAMGFAPFGIDDPTYHANNPIKKGYGILKSMMPLILDAQQEGRIKGFMEEGNNRDSVFFGDYKFVVDYGSIIRPEYLEAYGFILQLSDNEFVISGNGMSIRVFSTNSEKPNLSYLAIDEVEYINDRWKHVRMLSGDETINNGTEGLNFPPNPYNIGRVTPNDITVQKIKLYTF